METPPCPPELPLDAHKGDAGRVLAVVGSRAMPGAAILVARAAQRAGAGLVTLAVHDRGVVQCVAPAAPEAIFVLLDERSADAAGDPPGEGRAVTRALPPSLAAARADVRLVGCGRGDDAATRALVHALVADAFSGPLVVDADGLNAVAGEPERLARARGLVVVTPHPGEAERLLARRVGSATDDRVRAAHELARRVRGIAVLKGHATVVSDGEREWIAATGNAGMATAGAGDVLAGIVAAYLCTTVRDSGRASGHASGRAEALDAFDATCAAVHVHGLAGDLAAAALGQRALVASDLVEHLAAAQRAHRSGTVPA